MSHRSGRPADWEQLVTEHENRLYRAALAILGNPQEAEVPTAAAEETQAEDAK